MTARRDDQNLVREVLPFKFAFYFPGDGSGVIGRTSRPVADQYVRTINRH
jgi:exosome complex RNA-binding protein Csl4